MSVNVQTASLPGAPAIEAAAAEFRRALREGDSVLTPGQPVWTADHAHELLQKFNGRPDVSGANFEQKLAKQLADVSPGAVQLFAELYSLDLLPLTDYKPATKRGLIAGTLALAGETIALPPVLDAAFDVGVLAGGVAFKTRRYFQLCYLIEFATGFLTLPSEDLVRALDDPLDFRSILDSVTSTSAPSQRATLLFLYFPEFFFAIASDTHRRRIRTAFADKIGGLSSDEDQDLHQIYAVLLEESGKPFSFYRAPYREMWNPIGDSDAGQRAWLVRGSNVNGLDLVPGWLSDRRVTLAATYLGEVDAGLHKDELKPIVEANYSFATYVARRELLDAFYQFLTTMQESDLIATIDQGRLYIGEIEGDAGYDATGTTGASLVRDVRWTLSEGVDLDQLSVELKARLSTQRDVLDLTQQLGALQQLAGAETTAPVPDPEVGLSDATPELATALHVDQAWLQKCIDLLNDRPQLIFYGPPGTGKTYIARELAKHVAADNVSLVQFHPAYSYEDFFEGFRPTVGGGFELKPGPLRRIVDHAVNNPSTPHVLIIDEINRANLAKVFGELYFLLEYRSENVELLYSEADFSLPSNVYIIGTMNTADRSIALVDAAMRRRFAFLPLHPSDPPTRSVLRRWLQANEFLERNADLLDELNARIGDADFEIGPSYFMRKAVYADGGLQLVWETAILPLLEEWHYGELDRAQIQQRYGLDTVSRRVDRAATATSVEEESDAAAPGVAGE